MTERRLLPHLAAVSNELLGGDDEKLPPPDVRAAVGAKAGAGQPTVDRFLQGERVPRNKDLDAMIAAVAEVAERDWLDPWQAAIDRARKARAGLESFLPTPPAADADLSEDVAKAERDLGPDPGSDEGRGGPGEETAAGA